MEMENMEMINETEVLGPEFDAVEYETEESGIGTGLAMLIGAGLTVATGAIVTFAKKAWAKHKAKKEAECPAEEHDFVEPTDDEIKTVTGK